MQLVIQAGAIGRDGEVLVLDMGEPVQIDDVARQLIALSGKRIDDRLHRPARPGEKLHEELFGDGEPDERPVHPLISHTPGPALLAPSRPVSSTRGSVRDCGDPVAGRGLSWMHARQARRLDASSS